MTTILAHRKLYNIVEEMKREQRKITHILEPLQDEALKVLKGLAIAQRIMTLAMQDTEAKLTSLIAQAMEEILNREK
jgi:hypothetical protein